MKPTARGAATASATARAAAIPRHKRRPAAAFATRAYPPGPRKPAHSRRFLFAPEISRYEKNFCVVKNHAAWHNPTHCSMENHIPQ
ncbi:hypothetical protein FE789_12050 [Burkholderia pseudomallei]|nr:hypothetical protein FE789_12050 [Burkholderia pseudomallei]